MTGARTPRESVRSRAAAAVAVGAVFGATLSWTGMSSPVVLRQGLLFERSYLFLFFAAAVSTAFVGLRLLRLRPRRALLTGEPVAWGPVRLQRRHLVGSVIFGIGWGVADACPGPIATQLAQGVPWSVFTAVGLVVGVLLYLRREEPAPASAPARAAPPLGGARARARARAQGA